MALEQTLNDPESIRIAQAFRTLEAERESKHLYAMFGANSDPALTDLVVQWYRETSSINVATMTPDDVRGSVNTVLGNIHDIFEDLADMMTEDERERAHELATQITERAAEYVPHVQERYGRIVGAARELASDADAEPESVVTLESFDQLMRDAFPTLAEAELACARELNYRRDVLMPAVQLIQPLRTRLPEDERRLFDRIKPAAESIVSAVAAYQRDELERIYGTSEQRT